MLTNKAIAGFTAHKVLQISETLQGGLRERGDLGKKVQGAGSMGSERPGSREQRKVI